MTLDSTRRLFFAFWPEEALRAQFAHATHKAVRGCGGRPVPAQNLHITLLFLGSVAESRIPDLTTIGSRAAAVLRGEAAAAQVPQLVFDRIEFWEKARVLVATTNAVPEASGQASGHASPLAAPAPAVATEAMSGLAVVTELVESLLREAHGAGFVPDLKPFRAHVTVARKVARVGRELHMHPVHWPVTGFSLVESRTLPEGPLYSVVDSWEPSAARHN